MVTAKICSYLGGEGVRCKLFEIDRGCDENVRLHTLELGTLASMQVLA